MSFYTSTIKSHQIDPVFDRSLFRTEFRLDEDKVYLSNLRIANVGLIPASGTNKRYQFFTGAYGVIKDIQLLDGGKVIDELKEFQTFIAFKNYNQSNDENKSKAKYLNRSNYGFTLEEGNPATIDPVKNNSRPVKYSIEYDLPGGLSTTDNEVQYGWLSLKDVFGFLAEAPILPTGVMRNLRVVVNYVKTEVANVPLTNNDSTPLPVLLADEVMDEGVAKNLLSQFSGLKYKSIEHDRVIVPVLNPAVGTTQNQKVQFRVNGFNGKAVDRLLMVNTPTTQATGLYTNGSTSQLNQRVQVRVNGSNRLPFNGITRPNERLQLLTQSWGTCNTVPGASSGTTNVLVYNPATSTNLRGIIGSQDYFGMRIGDVVEDLQIEYERDGVHDPTTGNQQLCRYNQQINLDMFAEVSKTLAVSGTDYEIFYDGSMM